jgi:MoxR-like ATPase
VKRSPAPAARLYRQLLAYIGAYPHAADSLEGVMRFWLGLQYADDTLQDAVLQALARLMSQGLLSKKTSSDGTVLYFASTKRQKGESTDEPAP